MLRAVSNMRAPIARRSAPVLRAYNSRTRRATSGVVSFMQQFFQQGRHTQSSAQRHDEIDIPRHARRGVIVHRHRTGEHVCKPAPSSFAPTSRSTSSSLSNVGLPCKLYAVSQPVQGTDHALAAAIEYVRVNHRCRNIGVAEQFLHGADVVPPPATGAWRTNGANCVESPVWRSARRARPVSSLAEYPSRPHGAAASRRNADRPKVWRTETHIASPTPLKSPLPAYGEGEGRGPSSAKTALILSFSRGEKGPGACRSAHYLCSPQ